MPHDKIGLKLGTVNTLVFRENSTGIVHEPSIIAYNINNNSILGIGETAKHIIGRTPQGVIPVQPVQNGVITEFDMSLKLVKYFLKKIKCSKVFKPQIVMNIPSGLTSVENKEVIRLLNAIGNPNTYIVNEAVSTAFGCGMEIERYKGIMIVDLGGGRTSCTMVSCGDIVAESSIKVGGRQLDADIRRYLKHKHHLLVGEITSELLKTKHATVAKSFENYSVEVKGMDLITGLPKKILVQRDEFKIAIEPTVDIIIGVIKKTIAMICPDLINELIVYGFMLTGGTALLNGLVERVEKEVCCPVQVAINPTTTIVAGTFVALRELNLKRIS